MKIKVEYIDICASLLAAFALFATISALIALDTSNYHYIYQLARNWSLKPIIDVYSDSNSKKCKALISDPWPGTNRGCYCDWQLFGSKLKSRSCDSDDSTCRDIYSIKPTQYQIWENTPLCAKFSHNSYFDMEIIGENQRCPNSYKNCGEIDTFKNSLCVREEEVCPISGIKIVTNKNDSTKTKIKRISNEEDLNKKHRIKHSFFKTSNNTNISNNSPETISISLSNDKVLQFIGHNHKDNYTDTKEDNDSNGNNMIENSINDQNSLNNPNDDNQSNHNNINNNNNPNDSSQYKSGDNNKSRSLSKVKIKKTSQNKTNQRTNYKSFNPIQIEDREKFKKLKRENKKDINLDINNNNDIQIIPIELRVEEDTPCKNSKYYNIKHETYALDSAGYFPACESINNEFLDNDYIKLDTTNNLELLQQNGLYKQIESLPENDERYWNYPVNLYSKSYVGVEYRCHRDLSQTLTSEVLLQMITMRGSFDTEQTVFGILIAFTSILFFMVIVLTVAGCKIPDSGSDRNIFNKLTAGVYGGFGVINLILISILFFQHNLDFQRNNYLEAHDCVDPTTAYVFTTFYSEFDYVGSKLITLLTINILLAVYRLVYLLFFT